MAEPRALTAKQTAYRDARTAGATRIDAYRGAYNAEKMSKRAIEVECSRLDRHPAVALSLRVVAQQAAERSTVTAQRILERAWEIASSDAKDRVPALAVAARAFPEFRDSPLIDNSQHLTLPPGTTLEDLRQLRDGLRGG